MDNKDTKKITEDASKKTQDDLIKLSQAMDNIALLIKNKQNSATNESSQDTSAPDKWKQLSSLVNSILDDSKQSHQNHSTRLCVDLLSCKNNNELEIIERFNDETKSLDKFALVPLVELDAIPPSLPSTKNKKKNNIKCSFCNEPGHKRSSCNKRFLK
ncbi:hypothetical protein TBLA_0B08130 [Henningerozyma blattae CBS 6284]|uniref:CCHC-type domain-containing protein n=1 Tax=Henningerozyma blattae (strain ATCC 34711 / CBS 6284 / DSM 70876 / NBRC 10599 / NRRL Y-10934 / UCD 77-7) TaxID=1071380 RepID=I2GZS7_HENB6|nr:hypothetical protein TBLA_0B08130 [Tetrapisispora blattae CBS 6284]CCH59629.1 hypothetical protein TBLA_0B08130 [Tetrapisispora blattae CBS 6284]